MTTSAFDALPPGARLLGDHVIERRLGAGPFGMTYLARDVRLDREVVIQEYLPARWGVRGQDGTVAPASEDVAEQYARGLERFLADARALAKVDQHQVVRVHGVTEAHGTAYLTMERVRGRSLEQVVREDGPLPEDAVRTMLGGLAAGLSEVHALEMLHLDIRPDQVILRSSDSTAVLIGFGSARSQVGEAARDLWTMPTPGYAPIEQYSPNGRQGPWTDIYALGAVAYFALTGRTPVDAPERLRRDTLRDVRKAAAQPVSASFARAVAAALQVGEEDRPNDLETWRAMLAGGPVPGKRAARAWGRRPRSAAAGPAFNRRRLFYGLGVTAILAGTAVVVFVSRNTAITPEERASAAETLLDLSPEVIASVEAGLIAEGFHAGDADGVLEEEARTGLREWQSSNALPATGYLDRASVAELLPLGQAAERQAEIARLQAEEAPGRRRKPKRRSWKMPSGAPRRRNGWRPSGSRKHGSSRRLSSVPRWSGARLRSGRRSWSGKRNSAAWKPSVSEPKRNDWRRSGWRRKSAWPRSGAPTRSDGRRPKDARPNCWPRPSVLRKPSGRLRRGRRSRSVPPACS